MSRQFARDALFLARTDAWRLLRTRETLLWTFVMPIMFFYFIGMVNNGGSADTRDTLAVSAAPDSGFLADELIRRLAAHDYRIVKPATRESFLTYSRRLEIPAGFTDSVLAGTAMKIEFARTGEGQEADYDRVRLTRATYGVLADLVVATRGGGQASAEAFRALDAEPRTLQLNVRMAGRRLVPPSGYDQAVPGTMVMFTLTVLLTAGAMSLTLERNSGVLRRLAYSPISRGSVVAGKWAARMALGAIQISVAMFTGRLLFHVHWGPNAPMVFATMLAYGSLAATLAMLLGNFARSVTQVMGLGIITSSVLAALGGCWWPIEITPLWAQRLAMFLPTGWTMAAVHKLVNYGDGPASVLPHVAASLAAASAAGWLLARKFRYQ